MKNIILVMKAEIVKQQQYDYHSYFVYFSLLIWPVLGFLEIYYTYKPFNIDSEELLSFLATGFMAYTCFWSMVQNAWSMANQERRMGTLEAAFLTPANRMAMTYGKALGSLMQEVWMFSCFCIFILFYTKTLRAENLFLLPVVLLLLLVSSTIWGGMLNVMFLFSRDASIIMNVLDTPMTLFSGTRIPVHSFPEWAKGISMLFPLTYCINIMRLVLGIQNGEREVVFDLGGLVCCLLLMVVITLYLIRKAEEHNRETGELQFY